MTHDLEELSSQTKGVTDKRDTAKECLSLDPEERRKTKAQLISPYCQKFSPPELFGNSVMLN